MVPRLNTVVKLKITQKPKQSYSNPMQDEDEDGRQLKVLVLAMYYLRGAHNAPLVTFEFFHLLISYEFQSGALQSRPPCVMCPSAHLMQLLPHALAVSSLLSSHTSVPLANALW